MLFGIVVSSNNYNRYIKINLEIYKKILLKFGNFYIIDLSDLGIYSKKIKKAQYDKKVFSKKIKIFKPKTKSEFYIFFKNKSLMGFNNLGKTLFNIPIYYHLNKIDFKQINLMNYGHINNAVEIFKNNDFNFSNLTGKVFFFQKYSFITL